MPKFKTLCIKNLPQIILQIRCGNAYEDGQPVSVNIMMEFAELTPIYANDYGKYAVDDIGL